MCAGGWLSGWVWVGVDVDVVRVCVWKKGKVVGEGGGGGCFLFQCFLFSSLFFSAFRFVPCSLYYSFLSSLLLSPSSLSSPLLLLFLISLVIPLSIYHPPSFLCERTDSIKRVEDKFPLFFPLFLPGFFCRFKGVICDP